MGIYDNDDKVFENAIRNFRASIAEIGEVTTAVSRFLSEKINEETDSKKREELESNRNELESIGQYNFTISEEFVKNVEKISKMVNKIKYMEISSDKAIIQEQQVLIQEQQTKIQELEQIINQFQLSGGNLDKINEIGYTEEEKNESVEEHSDDLVENTELEKVEEEKNNLIFDEHDIDEEEKINEIETEEQVEEETNVGETTSLIFDIPIYQSEESVEIKEEPPVVSEEEPIIVDIPVYQSEESTEIKEEQPVVSEEESVIVDIPIYQSEESTEIKEEQPVVSEDQDVNIENSELESGEITITQEQNLVNDLPEKKRFVGTGARAIMIGKSQSEKLDASVVTQEALLHERGSLGSYMPNMNIEQSEQPIVSESQEELALISAGLLEPNKEQIINEKLGLATKLYNEGKVEEAEQIMKEVELLNSENNGLVK